MKTIRMKFATNGEKPYILNLNYASGALLTDEGKVLVSKAMAALIENKPFTVQLTKAEGAELIERKVTQII